jgi:hypothetical protein
MTAQAIGLAALLVTGLALIARGLSPRRLSAQDAVLVLAGDRPSRRHTLTEVWTTVLKAVLATDRVDRWLTPIRPDLEITGLTAETFTTTLTRRSLLALTALALWATGLVVPVPFSPVVVVAVAVGVVAVLWVREVTQLRAVAGARRRTLTSVVQGLMTITMVGATTATPINEVAERALDHGTGWAYDLLRAEFRRGTADNLRIYESLAGLADRVDSRSLRLYADTIRTGDRDALAVTTIAQRARALQEEIAAQVITEAEQHAKTLQLPIATFAITIVLITVGVPLLTGFQSP